MYVAKIHVSVLVSGVAMVWCGVVWCGMGWYGMVWEGVFYEMELSVCVMCFVL